MLLKVSICLVYAQCWFGDFAIQSINRNDYKGICVAKQRKEITKISEHDSSIGGSPPTTLLRSPKISTPRSTLGDFPR